MIEHVSNLSIKQCAQGSHAETESGSCQSPSPHSSGAGSHLVLVHPRLRTQGYKLTSTAGWHLSSASDLVPLENLSRSVNNTTLNSAFSLNISFFYSFFLRGLDHFLNLSPAHTLSQFEGNRITTKLNYVAGGWEARLSGLMKSASRTPTQLSAFLGLPLVRPPREDEPTWYWPRAIPASLAGPRRGHGDEGIPCRSSVAGSTVQSSSS